MIQKIRNAFKVDSEQDVLEICKLFGLDAEKLKLSKPSLVIHYEDNSIGYAHNMSYEEARDMWGDLVVRWENMVVRDDKLDSALTKQVAGSHYKDLAIQPIEYCQKNNMNYCESNVVKYVTRHKSKNGKQDLEKAIHCLQLLIEMEYGESK